MGFIEISGKLVEFEWINKPDPPQPKKATKPVVIFLHEGLGSCAMWKNFPVRLVKKLDCYGLIYSRHGYGKSEERDEFFSDNYHLEEASEVLKKIICKLCINKPIIFGHSDGATIGLIYAALHRNNLRGLIAVAPHTFVENITIAGILETCAQYDVGNLRRKLSKYHEKPDMVFDRWSKLWLNPSFRNWNVVSLMRSITKPVLLLQGEDDNYGSEDQIKRLEKTIVAPVRSSFILNSGHAPHYDNADVVIKLTEEFCTELS